MWFAYFLVFSPMGRSAAQGRGLFSYASEWKEASGNLLDCGFHLAALLCRAPWTVFVLLQVQAGEAGGGHPRTGTWCGFFPIRALWWLWILRESRKSGLGRRRSRTFFSMEENFLCFLSTQKARHWVGVGGKTHTHTHTHTHIHTHTQREREKERERERESCSPLFGSEVPDALARAGRSPWPLAVLGPIHQCSRVQCYSFGPFSHLSPSTYHMLRPEDNCGKAWAWSPAHCPHF
jgi:hypothetical protein